MNYIEEPRILADYKNEPKRRTSKAKETCEGCIHDRPSDCLIGELSREDYSCKEL